MKMIVMGLILIFNMQAVFSAKVGLLVMATGKYISFVPALIHSAEKHFCCGHDVTFFIFTDGVLQEQENVVSIDQQQLGWPYDTMHRYHVYLAHQDDFADMDYLFACDADMLFVDEVGDEILGERVATLHPGFAVFRNTFNENPVAAACMADQGGYFYCYRGTYETNPLSAAYVSNMEGKGYFAGGFYGGTRQEFIQILETNAANIDRDLEKGIVAVWHDESHWNRYCIDHEPSVVLSPSYCYREEMDFPYKRKLVALDKDHDELRSGKYGLVICAVFQNEAFFLKEWLEYHLMLGVEHFYLYDNLSMDHYEEILEPYIENGLVDLFAWPVESADQDEYIDLVQLATYNHALEIVRESAEWAAFIDLDEFLVPVDDDNLYHFIQQYRDYGGLSINWQMYGTSGMENLPEEGLIIENLNLKAPTLSDANKTAKLIVQPNCVKCINNPHYFDFQEGSFAVDSNKQAVEPQQRGHPIVIDKIRINHYWFGTENWFTNHKVPRRTKWGMVFSEKNLQALMSSFNEEKDEIMQKFVPQLKRKMKPFIIGELMGQLGNQLFIIAATTSLALDHGAMPLFPSLITESKFDIPFNYAQMFSHLDASYILNPIDHYYGERQFHYAPIPYQRDMKLIGFFQSEKYFRHHKEEICNLFAPKPEILDYITDKYGWILAYPKTVSIHYRSYLLEDPTHDVFADCGIEYFEKAIALFPKESLFVVFSNDIGWCKDHFTGFDRNFYFVEGESHIHDLYLMSLCQDNIISNSTFSWWGAYLNLHEDKRVVAPAEWFNRETYQVNTDDLIPEEWNTL